MEDVGDLSSLLLLAAAAACCCCCLLLVLIVEGESSLEHIKQRCNEKRWRPSHMEAALLDHRLCYCGGRGSFLVVAAPDSEKGTLRSLLEGGIVDVYVDDNAVFSERWRGRRITMRS